MSYVILKYTKYCSLPLYPLSLCYVVILSHGMTHSQTEDMDGWNILN